MKFKMNEQDKNLLKIIRMPDVKTLKSNQKKLWNSSLINFSNGRRLYKKMFYCKSFKNTIYSEYEESIVYKKISNYFSKAYIDFIKMNCEELGFKIRYCNEKIIEMDMKLSKLYEQYSDLECSDDDSE